MKAKNDTAKYAKKKLGENVRKRRVELDMSQDKLASMLGYKSRSTIAKIEVGENDLTQSKINKMAAALDTTPAYLMGWEANVPGITQLEDGDLAEFPIIGSIAAGYGSEAVEEYTGEMIQIPSYMLGGRPAKDFFVLRVKGNSMYPQFLDGDKVLVLRCTSVDSGSVAVLLYEQTEATIKKVVYTYGEDWFELIPANPEYPTKRVEGSDLETCRVVGKVKMLLRNID
ncbi:XRE family transcriptional regulator [Christensenellaceae bacterium OttesenSCG-928-L17]|nr:XRE family transcriptional regulator [Christensenellaceae bacterium OttesenSCG-928-L17]